MSAIRSVNEYECAIAKLTAHLRHCVNEMRRAGYRMDAGGDARRLLHAANDADALLRQQLDEAVKLACLEPPTRVIWVDQRYEVSFSESQDPANFAPSACTAHVTPDPLAQQQAQTAGQVQSVRHAGSLPCASCGLWLKPNNGVTVAGKLYHMNCATTQAQQAQQPASAMPPWGNWPNIVGTTPAIQSVMPTLKCPHCANVFPSMAKDKAICPGCAKPMEYDINRQAWQTGGDGVATVFSDAQCPDFGAQVSDQLAKQRGIDKAAASERMRVPTFEEQEAERARLADLFRKRGVL